MVVISAYLLYDFLRYVSPVGQTNRPSYLRRIEDQVRTPQVEEKAAEPVIAVDPQRLISDYRTNEVAADMAYKGKILQITGAIASINKDFLDEPYVVISGYFQGLSSIQCCFGKGDEPALSRLQTGQLVTISGRCSGMIMLSVFLKNCTLDSSTEAPEKKSTGGDRELRAQIAKEVGITIDESGNLGGTPEQQGEWIAKYVMRTGRPLRAHFSKPDGMMTTQEYLMLDGKLVIRDIGPSSNNPATNQDVPGRKQDVEGAEKAGR
jgi:hypothetical protein